MCRSSNFGIKMYCDIIDNIQQWKDTYNWHYLATLGFPFSNANIACSEYASVTNVTLW